MLNISKYHGLGNDFVFGDYNDFKDFNHSEIAITLCDRHSGIGADGLILVKQDPLEMIYYNSDGSRAEMCGNGIRCFAKYVSDKNILDKDEYDVVTLAGVMKIHVVSRTPFMVEINMGMPDYTSSNIPLLKDNPLDQTFEFGTEEIIASSVLLGVPHTVVEVETLQTEEMVRVGKLFDRSPLFPESTNVNFYQVLDSKNVKMQTFERGAGLTLACGTGACATFAILHSQGKVENNCNIKLPLGDLVIREENKEIFMMGPAELVFDGTINEEVFQ